MKDSTWLKAGVAVELAPLLPVAIFPTAIAIGSEEVAPLFWVSAAFGLTSGLGWVLAGRILDGVVFAGARTLVLALIAYFVLIQVGSNIDCRRDCDESGALVLGLTFLLVDVGSALISAVLLARTEPNEH